MSKPLIRIHNVETDEIIDREMNDAEFTKYQAEQELEAQRQTEAEAKVQAKAALLNRLGLTEEEARILLGGN
jgi:hypothetical protein